MSIDLIAAAMQLNRGFHQFGENMFPSGNVPVAMAEFFTASSSLLNLVTLSAAAGSQWGTGAAMLAQVQPLTQTLSGISLFGNGLADVFRLASAIDSGNQEAIDAAALTLMLSVTGSLLATAYVMAYGAGTMALMGPAGLGYLAGGLLAGVLLKIVKDPLVIDLDGDGIELSSLSNSTVHFDYAGDGYAEQTGWVSANDGMLAIDDNGNGLIDSGLELFGSSTQDGFAVLEKLDSNGDGSINAQDADFSKLKVWQDANQNGVTDAGELKTLSELGIVSFSLDRNFVGSVDQGNVVGYEAVFARADGTTGATQTIYFQTDPRQSLSDNTPEFTPANGVELLPELSGSGLIDSISYKATIDADFRAAWTALTDNAGEMSVSELRASFQALLLRWANVDTVDVASRGQFVNAQHLAFLEKFLGDTYREIQRGEELRTYPSTAQLGLSVETAFQQIVGALELGFLAQVGHSVVARGQDLDVAITNPYYFYSLLDLAAHEQGDEVPDTPANIGDVVDILIATSLVQPGKEMDFLVKALTGLDGIVSTVFGGDRAAYATVVTPHLNVIPDEIALEIATHIIAGTANVGTTISEGIIGTSNADVVIAGGGGDVVNGGSGSDIYVYEKHDGDLWVKDDSVALADSDTLVLTDLNSSDLSFVRIGSDLLIKVAETGKSVAIEGFFAGNGIEVLRFADGTEWNRTQIKDASVYQGDGHGNVIIDSASDDVIHGGQGDDVIQLSAGNDTIFYGKGDGYDIVSDLSNSPTEHGRLVLTDLNASDIELSRAGSHLFVTVKSTGEYVDFTNFFYSGDWNIDEIKFANGESWNRTQIQNNVWYRGTDRGDSIFGSDLGETIQGGKGDDILDGWKGSDTYIWSKGDGNDQITDANFNDGDVDTLWLKNVSANDVAYSYHGSTLLLTIKSTGEILTVPQFFAGVTDLLTGAGDDQFGIDVIRFENGTTVDRLQIMHNAGVDYLGWKPVVSTFIDGGLIIWQVFVDEFGHAGNIVSHFVNDINDIWNAGSYGGLGGILGGGGANVPGPFHGAGKNILNGHIGNDILAGGDAQDVLVGADGDDILFGDYVDENVGYGNDIIDGGPGNDVLYGGRGMDLISGGYGNDYISGGDGKDYISGSSGNDTFVGGKGDDVLTSDVSGNDVFIYSKGDGNDIINEPGSVDAQLDQDTLVLTDIDSSGVELSRSGDNLLILVKSTGDIITVLSHFSSRGSNNNVSGGGLEIIRFANGEWDRQRIQEAAWIRGADGRDILGDTSSDTPNSTFDGGKGNDVIFAGQGNTTFVYASGDGNDVINDSSSHTFAPNAIDTLAFSDLNAEDVELSRSGDDLLIKVLATGDIITVNSQLSGSLTQPDTGIEVIKFANGEEWGRLQIQQSAWYRGTDGRDQLTLDYMNDTVEGGKGDDIILSGYFSASGNDTFVYAKGDGNDVIREETRSYYEAAEIDVLKFRDVDSSDVQLTRSGDDLLIKIISTNETITILKQFVESQNAPGAGLEYIQFANGDRWGRETIFGIATSSSPFMAGTSGNDTLVGSSVAQNFYGEAGNDTLDGQGGSDLLYGGLGDDKLMISVSTPGDLVTADGGVGTDTLDLSGFGAGVWVDLVTNGAEARTTDQVDLASGTWRDIADVARVENIAGTAFSDQISGDAGNNILIGGAGDDILDARSGDDILLGGAGNDNLTGGMGNDQLDGGDGTDVLNGGIGTDTLIGGAGNDALTGGTASDIFVVNAGAGSDTITDFAAGSDIDHDVIKFDRSHFSDYASLLAAATQVGSDVVISLAGGDSLTLQNVDLSSLTADNFEFRRLDNTAPTAISVTGGAVIEGAAGGTVVASLAAIDTGDMGAHTFSIVGSDSLFEIIGNEIRVKDGAIVDFEAAAQHQLSVKAVDDDGLSVTSTITVNITDQIETLTGTAGSDVLTGGGGSDVLIGGAGNDRLVGAGGSDEYQYNQGDGHDRIVDAGSASNADRLVLGAGIDPSSVTVGRSSLASSDVVLLLATGETIVLQDQLSGSTGAGLEEIRFADNTIWTRSEILSRLDAHLVIGSNGTEALTGSGSADVFVAGTGNETLTGYAGSDTYRVGQDAGNDIIVEGSEAGTDRIELVGLTSGDVQFTRSNADLVIKITATGRTITVVSQFGLTSAGIEQIAFADATVWDRTQIANNSSTQGTTGADTVVGTPGDDVLQPGLGSDLIQAGAGSDTIIYALGDGSDTINDGANSAQQIDSLRFVDLNIADVSFVRQGNNLVINVLSSGDAITVQQQFTSPTDFWGLEQVQFADGTVWNKAAITAAALIRGTSGAETLNGTSEADVLDGLGGNDDLRGGNGGDTYLYRVGSGNDWLYENGSDTGTDTVKLEGLTSADVELSRTGVDLTIRILSSGETLKVDDQFNGSYGIEQIIFADGITWDRTQITDNAWFRGSSNGETLNGSTGADTLDGKAGNDYLIGGDGGDTYIFATGYGNDTVTEYDIGTGTDQIRLVGLNPANVTFGRSGNNLLIQISASGETLKVENQFNGSNGIEQVAFADGSTWDRAQIADAAWFRGTSGNDSISGMSSNDVLFGDLGNDYLRGNNGADTYVYVSGHGNDEVDDESGSVTDIDVLKFTDLNAGDITLDHVGNNLVVGIISTGATIKIDYQFYSLTSNWGIEKFQFANGDSWDLATINAHAWIRGTTGNDTIAGSSWNDTFLGGLGNDRFNSGAGSDTYIYALGDGNDYINDDSGSTADIDVLHLTDLNATDLTFSRVGVNLVATVNSNGQTITFDEQFYSQTANWGIEKIEFANGVTWDLATINAHAWIRGTTGNDTIAGFTWSDTFLGGLGNDRFNSGPGSDTYIYALGDGDDYINDESGSTTDIDVLRLIDLNASDLTFSRTGVHLVATVNSNGQTITFDEQFYSQTANWGIEKIEFADGSNWDLATINAQAWIRGTTGNDTIAGSTWNDKFSGGLGNDRFNSGAGSDTYIYALGDGNDYIDDESGSTTDVDVLRLTDLNASDLTFSRVGVHLVATVNSNGQTITFDAQFYSQTANWGLEKIEFADGSSWNLQTINANAWYRGTSGNDTISGSAWNDTIAGGAGNDVLSGGAGSDTFVFRAGLGQDTVTGFTPGQDVLDIGDGIFADATAALAAATASGNNTLITIDANNSILLQNVALASLHTSDLLIV
ncbi:calcium-binding protein [Bradyrhizobium sp. AUGA SZCCT0160]|uniref:calcium-binding protein n=1 Tax=Bradyrhizobium sp. AUGA SZCCT0160 TaxID=2807662 RepID=UPI001BA4ECF0|nr:calcium-binding protein [Bradyrhizobium sp. AUGA SZCCT0160]MBR1190231.1 hypothetical protein [Bradyrhizobium sp. AUGA SZCCT0160]